MKQFAAKNDGYEDDQWHEAKKAVDKLILAAKNIAFYPELHAVSQKSVADCHDHLRTYTDRYGAIVLEVGKNEIFFQGEPVYKSSDKKTNLAYLWYRDGLKWISFTEGIELAEILSFLNILKTQRMFEEESKGDIVTGLWEAGLLHIKYSTTNLIWKNEPLLDLGDLKISGDTDKAGDSPELAEEAETAETMLSRVRDKGLIRISPEEIEVTRHLIREEESRNFDQDVFDVLLVILNEQKEGEDFVTVLDILKDSFKRTIDQGRLDQARRFLIRFNHIRASYKETGTWALAYLDDFLLMISGPKVLSGLKTVLPQIKTQDLAKRGALEHLFLQLKPESLMAVAQLLPETKDKDLRNRLLGVMKQQAESDLRPLIHLARQGETEIQQAAVFIMGFVSSESAVPVILEICRSKERALRKTAVRALIRHSSASHEDRISLIKDPDLEIRQIIYNFLLQNSNPEMPTIILNYLDKGNFSASEEEALLLLYQALGSCCKQLPPAYLSYQLLTRPWHFGKLRRIHRMGAALALACSNSPNAKKALKKASKSIWPAVRRAVHRAEEYLNESSQ